MNGSIPYSDLAEDLGFSKTLVQHVAQSDSDEECGADDQNSEGEDCGYI